MGQRQARICGQAKDFEDRGRWVFGSELGLGDKTEGKDHTRPEFDLDRGRTEGPEAKNDRS